MLHVYLRQSRNAYALLSDALALHGFSSLPAIARTEAGKPFFLHHPELHFNLSHTGGWVMCALSDHPVGVDVEIIRPRKDDLIRYCLTEAEYAGFDGTWPDFYRIWTLKEAWCKYLGQPLVHPRRWPLPPPCLYRSYRGEDFAAAVCAEEAPASPIIL